MIQFDDTICAISTPQGTGGIAVVRISGEEAVSKVEQLTGRPLTKQVHYRRIPDLDDVVITTFRAPHSYTGEDIVEIACHGSQYIQQQLLHLLTASGIRQAQAGEFTKRAFLNGKIDLSQAEAVADLISAEHQAAHHIALQQLKGGISQSLSHLREQLLQLTSLLELELDFADHEELEFADRHQLTSLANEIHRHLSTLKDSFRLGNAIKNGVPVAIVGPTNVGKSTLLNALIGEDRAIVSDIHGTTRDAIEATATIAGVLFRFIDTAGLRQTNDIVEQIGINRTKDTAQKAELILYVADAANADKPIDLLPEWKEKTVIVVYNKTDLHPLQVRKEDNIVGISAKTGNIQPLLHRLQQLYSPEENTPTTVITNARHYDALHRAEDAIARVEQGLQDNLSGELLALDLHDCINALGEITGQITSEEVLHSVFSHFCIGK